MLLLGSVTHRLLHIVHCPVLVVPPTHFLSLESAWIRFAAELESAEAFLKTMDEIDFKQPYPPEAA